MYTEIFTSITLSIYKIRVHFEYKYYFITKLLDTYSVCQDGHDLLWNEPGTLKETEQ